MNRDSEITITTTDAGTEGEGGRVSTLQSSPSTSSYGRSDESNVVVKPLVTGAERSSDGPDELQSISLGPEIEGEQLQNVLQTYLKANADLVQALLSLSAERNSGSPDELKSIHGQRGLTLESEAWNYRKELQIYMQSINAILVGASVIVSITFSGFLQPPTGRSVKARFNIYVTLSFYSAVATVIMGAGATLPSWQSDRQFNGHAKQVVNRARRWLTATSVLFAFSITCALGAPPLTISIKEISVIQAVGLAFGLFLCAAAMTAYFLRLNWNFVTAYVLRLSWNFVTTCVLRLNWNFVLVLLGLNKGNSQPGGMRACVKAAEYVLSLLSKARLIVVWALIYFFFLVVLFFVPLSARYEDELAPDSGCAGAGHQSVN